MAAAIDRLTNQRFDELARFSAASGHRIGAAQVAKRHLARLQVGRDGFVLLAHRFEALPERAEGPRMRRIDFQRVIRLCDRRFVVA